jgi:hypothetical protein
LKGLAWLAKVGPAPLDAWRCAMGWSEVAARNHARRLEREGWLARYPMTRGEGSIILATSTGIAMLRLPIRAAGAPAPIWWAHHCGVAWTSAWLTARDRQLIGARELLDHPSWSGAIYWHDHKGSHTAGHRPDLIAILPTGAYADIEVELAQKSAERLSAILNLYVQWAASRPVGVIYVCGDQEGADRVRAVGERVGLSAQKRMRVELLATIKAEAVAACESNRAERRSVGSSGATRAVADAGTHGA